MCRTRLALVVLLSVAACGKGEDAAPKEEGRPSPAVAAVSSPYALPSDPGVGVPVLEAKAQGPKEEVVVVGRVREKFQRRAGFTLIDASVEYCGQTEMEGCETPWDYCCKAPDDLRRATMVVRVKDASGRTVQLDRIPELRNLDLVAVRGRLVGSGDDAAIEASGWYRRERPNLDWKIAWPE
jgi:hypothetical protein